MINVSRAAGLILLLIISAVSPGIVQADVLVMKNGDRITGEIKQIWDDEITIEPTYSDEFEVDVPEVDHIISEREFEIDLEDGRELVATFAGAADDGDQVLMADGQAVEVGLDEFLELDEPEEFYDWEANIDFSSTLNTGNTDSYNAQMRADGMFKHGDHRHNGEITFLREELADVPTKEQDIFRYNYNWLFNDPWFLAGNFSFEKDPIIELDRRLIGSVGLGRDIWNTPQRLLNFNLGVGVQDEKIGGVTETSSVATWTLRFSYDLFSGDMELFHNQNLSSNISGRTNANFRTSTGLRYEITDLLYANFTVNFDYQTDPVPGIENEDVAILMGFGAEFD